MSDAWTPLARIRLIDGRELLIGPDAARVGERTHLIARIDEARLLFLRPETIGLRMADVGLVEYTVERPGDGQAALETIYQLRPDLRRADLEPPAAVAPPGYQVLPPSPPESYGPGGPSVAQIEGVFAAPAPRVVPPPPSAFPPPSPEAAPFPPQVAQAYGPEPNRRSATLTPQPRGAGQLISATFRLAARRFGPLFALSILAAFLPNLALGGLSVAISLLRGENPFAVTPDFFAQLQQVMNGQTSTTTTPAATPADTLAGLLALVLLVASLVAAGWTVAVLTVAARDAALGRPISVAGCAREGWRRVGATLSALIITSVLLLIVAIPGLFSLALILALITPSGSAVASPSVTLVIVILAVMMIVVMLALLAWLWPRLALAPAAAALGMPTPIRTAWNLASGGSWRIFAALLAVGVVIAALIVPATLAQFYMNGLSALVLIPLAQLFTAPLSALVRTLALYDQRLRREGYALFLHEGVKPPATPGAPAPDAAAEQK